MKKYLVRFKDNRPAPNLCIEAYEFEEYFHVEIWDVFTNFHSFQMFEDERIELIESLRSEISELKKQLTNNKSKDNLTKEQILTLNNRISELNKWKNKRYRISKEEFHNTYLIGCKMYLDNPFKIKSINDCGNTIIEVFNKINCIY